MFLRIPENKGSVSRVYGGFLEMPVVFVLTTLWLAGLALIGSLVMLLYLYWELLLLAGS
jgi:hypothetical protein